MKAVEKAIPFPTLKTVVKQICVTFGLGALVVSFLSTRFLWGCGVADIAVPFHSTFPSCCLSDRDWGREFVLRLVLGLSFPLMKILSQF